ncbi:tRNA (guanosine(46)-N7)-methyltransferase TrmB [Jeotgalibacillus sp. R-1-5s-1]|uniref:tRNA (guanosine(46)-N7)-methyltransferase TrmB n=2 Tax=Jeotgalibacillus TaxID=157226 RepID=UPI00106B8E8B|nr:tRNA (guanosine(46)-N7)-methyltransferase TrmB [Jeotgalibacillus sp. R-1-5s-1]TFD98180.1 tRNA (guanosine(46)-N7)-methyltransferase TrmB [Jeotgalibacillus sp. R-1-5s-1]
MRTRNKPWAKDRLDEFPSIVPAIPQEHKGKWNAVFGNDNPIHIEVGMGKGQFITGMAVQNPDVNYIGIELSESVAVVALDKMIEADVPNVKLLTINAEILADVFEPGEVDRVYLNFSDPWPKTRHEKRRLTFKKFLDLYKTVLPENGEIHFKTDNRGLFEYSLWSFSQYGMLLKYVSLDLHKSDFEGNIMTEYEEKFSAKGQPIYRCEVQYQ